MAVRHVTAALALAAVALVGSSALVPTHAQSAIRILAPARAALAGFGKLAYVQQGRLYVLDANVNRRYELTHGGTATLPAWSHDGTWLAFAPTGDRALLVAGGPRPAYYGKRLMLCRESGSCQAVVRRQGVVSFDPAWSPDGREIAFTEAHALVAWGFSSKAPLRNWIRSHTLRIANADGSNPHQVTAAGNGVHDPEWSRDGRGILFVRDNALWFDANVGASSPQKVAQLFPARTRIGFASPCCGLFYYGHVQWDSLFAWDQG